MASPTVKDIRRAIEENGFWKLEDADIGKRVDNIYKTGFRLKTVEGLELCEASTFDDKVRGVIEAFFDRPVLGFYRVFGHMTNTHCILNRSDKHPQMRVLVVHACSSNSEMIFYETSHRHYLGANRAPNGLLGVPEKSLEQPGIIPKPVPFEHGGIVISDARIGWRVETGTVIIFGQMEPDEAKVHWTAKMPWPPEPALRAKVAQMDSKRENFSMNFDWSTSAPAKP